MIIKAKPRVIKYTEKNGFELIVKITEGPQYTIPLSKKQLETVTNQLKLEHYRIEIEDL